ncbi:hypothetical protein FB388_1257 [Pseudonocardia cypriaca]|uniref:Uncharacterized protein n=1 Tax=Pseudonocardia cypriaca TaxID=882449 RepID=A0A543GCU8_9PSEU|nr:hypothetical protein FB388_1257 [Pseudonocardia cypriaca]
MKSARQHLSDEDEGLVHDACCALEIAEGVIPEAALPALADPALRAAVAYRLQQCGRVLNRVGDCWTSGHDDEVADALVEQNIGTIDAQDRAVLALVLLRCVAIPRAQGAATGTTWADVKGARSTTIEELALNKSLSKKAIKESLQRLQTAALIKRSPRNGITPGPALHRLTPQRTTALWEDLVILAAPDTAYARVLRERRANSAQRKLSTKDQP